MQMKKEPNCHIILCLEKIFIPIYCQWFWLNLETKQYTKTYEESHKQVITSSWIFAQLAIVMNFRLDTGDES